MSHGGENMKTINNYPVKYAVMPRVITKVVNGEKINELDSEIEKLEKAISNLKDENELIKLRIKKKELILLKLELEELK